MATVATRRATSRVLKTSVKPAKVPLPNADDLADALTNKLKISAVEVKLNGKRVAPTPEEDRIAAMRAVNIASQALSAIVQSGWKRSSELNPVSKVTLENATKSSSDAAKHIATLRRLCNRDVDVERAAASILGKLVALELFDLAIKFLEPMRAQLCAILGVASEVASSSHHVHLLSIPLPSPPPLDSVILSLVSTYFAHALTVLGHSSLSPSIEHFHATFTSSSPTLLTWLPTFVSLPEKHTDSILTRAYTAINRMCSSSSVPNRTKGNSSSTDDSHSRAVFCLRMYALSCLIQTLPGTIDPNSFWDQATRSGASYVKTFANVQQGEEQAIQVILKAYIDLVAHAERRSDRESFMCVTGNLESEGKSFHGFCEYWMAFAKRAGDICVLQQIGTLMQVAISKPPIVTGLDSRQEPVSTTPIGSKKELNGKELVEGTRICTLFAQVTNLLDSYVEHAKNLESNRPIEEELVKQMKESIIILKTSVTLNVFLNIRADEDSKEVKRIGGKVDRAFEKLRRTGIKLIEVGTPPTSPTDSKIHECLRKLLEACIDALSRNLQPPTTDGLTRTIDTLFILARTSLVVADPRTYVPAYEYLSRASVIVDSVASSTTHSDSENTIDVPNYMRCVSGAFHNLAGALYQSSRYGAAVPFLLEGCTLGGRALLCRVHQEKGKDAEGWKQLEEQLCRRWELLGVCYSKNGDRKNAYMSFVQYIRAFPFRTTDFVTLTDNMSVANLFSSSASTAIKQLASIIERVTYLGACELLLDSKEVSMKNVLSSHSCFFDSSASSVKTISEARILAALIEAQLDCLESHRWKDGMNTLFRKLLNDAMGLYQAEGEHAMPIRRARILVRLMEAGYRDGINLQSQMIAELAREVEELLSREVLGCDQFLIEYRAQYRASAHLWLGLHGHRRADEHQGTLMKQHADEAVKILKSLLFPTSKTIRTSSTVVGAVRRKASPKVRGKSVATVGSPKPRIQRMPAAPKKAPLKSTRKDPVTPKMMPRTALQVISMNVTPPRPSSDGQMHSLVFDNFDKFISLLQLNAQILGLLGLTMPKVYLLDATRKLCERHAGAMNGDCMSASIELAHEYVKLGRRKRAGIIFSQCLEYVKSDRLPDEICALFYLRFAEALALAGDIPRSSSSYCEALVLADRLNFEDKNASTVLRIHARVKRLESAALGSHAFAMIQYAQDNVLGFIESMLQALRLWNRAVDTLSRLSTPPDLTQSELDPFHMSSLKDTLPNTTTIKQEEPIPHKPYRRPTLNNLEWRVSEGLLMTLFDLCQAYLDRGSVREAEYFAQQAQDLAEALNAPPMTSCALAKKGEIQLYQGLIAESYTTLTQAATLLSSMPGVVLADIQRLQAAYNERNADYATAQTLYGGTMVMLEDYGESFKAFDGIAFGPRKSIGSSPRVLATTEIVAPELLAAILHRLIWLLRDEDPEALNILRDKLSSFSHSIYSKAQELSLNAKLTLHNVYERFHADMFLSSLVESTISLPMGMSSNHDLALTPSTQEVLSALDSAEKLYQENLVSTASRGSVVSVRESALSLALIRAFQTSLGRLGNGGPAVSAFLLDLSSAITLRREMLEVIEHKYPVFYDDLHWRTINKDGTPLSRPTPPRGLVRSTSLDSDDEGDDENAVDNISSLKDYWHSVKVRYQAQSFTDAQSTPQLDLVPASWTIVHINVTEDKNTLFISRQEGGVASKEPLIFRVPLKGRRDNGSGDDDDEYLTFEDALSELKDIVRLSDEGTKAAINIKSDDVAGRTCWWKQRGDLNTRMKELLDNIEFCWLGAFKTILSPRLDLTKIEISSLRDQFDKAFQRSLYLKDPKKKPKRLGAGQHKKTVSLLAEVNVRLDDNLIKCFSTLSPKCRDEELEDLVYFILDLYQFHGVPVAIAEVDVTQVVVDLRAVLEDHASKIKVRTQRETLAASEPEHLFLVLDKNVQGIPWESIPILRGRSVSRIPSVDFLKDRIALSRWQRRQSRSDDLESSSATSDDARGMVVDPRKGFFILNPSGDLSRTEERFKQWAVGMQSEGWDGIIGQTVSEQQFLNALRTQDLVVYFGHGGGEQYVRSHKIRSLPRCAATMLWGCSSGALREMGDFDRVGTPYNYMLAGCPTLVANLWDVTDRDIDKFSQAVFDKLKLSPIELARRVDNISPTKKTSVVAAVAQSRDACKLKYLTGAAPVVYGIPFYL